MHGIIGVGQGVVPGEVSIVSIGKVPEVFIRFWGQSSF